MQIRETEVVFQIFKYVYKFEAPDEEKIRGN